MKSIKMVFLATVGALSLGTITSSFAACGAIPCGWYIDGNVGPSQLTNTDFPSGSSVSGNSYGVNVNAGYKTSPFFAVEMGYTHYGNSTVRDNLNEKGITIKNYAVDVAGKGILPIVNTGLELFAKVGVARLNVKTTISNPVAASHLNISSSRSRSVNGLYLGLGGDYLITPNIPFIIQWTRFRSNGNHFTGNIDLYSIGIGYIFG